MAKEAKKAAAPKKAAKPVKKNPLLEADEDTSTEEETAAEDTQDESAEDSEADEAEEGDNEEAEEEVEVAPKKAAKKAPEAPAKKPIIGDELASDIARTKAVLEREEKVHFMVPLAEGEKPGATHDVFINGFKTTVKKGVMTMVPRSVADLLANHYKVTAEAGADFRLDLNDEKANHL